MRVIDGCSRVPGSSRGKYRCPCRRGRRGSRGRSVPVAPRGARAIASATACADSSAGMMPFGPREQPRRGERLGVGGRDVLGAAAVVQPGVLRADHARNPARPRPSASARSGRRRPATGSCSAPCSTPGRAAARSAPRARPAPSPRPPASTPISRTLASGRNAWKMPMALLPPPTQAKTASGRRPSASRICAPRLLADHLLEIAHHHRVGMRAQRRAEQVMRRRDVGHPVAHGLADGVLERAAAARDAHHLGAQQAHAEDVEPLAPHVLLAHVDHALEAEQRADRGGGHAVLAGAGLGDDAPLAHAPRQQRLAQAVVDLVRAGVQQVLALEVDARAAQQFRSAAGRSRAASGGRRRCAAGRRARPETRGRGAPRR